MPRLGLSHRGDWLSTPGLVPKTTSAVSEHPSMASMNSLGSNSPSYYHICSLRLPGECDASLKVPFMKHSADTTQPACTSIALRSSGKLNAGANCGRGSAAEVRSTSAARSTWYREDGRVVLGEGEAPAAKFNVGYEWEDVTLTLHAPCESPSLRCRLRPSRGR